MSLMIELTKIVNIPATGDRKAPRAPLERIMVNLSHLVKVESTSHGTMVYVSIGGDRYDKINVQESYEQLSSMLSPLNSDPVEQWTPGSAPPAPEPGKKNISSWFPASPPR